MYLTRVSKGRANEILAGEGKLLRSVQARAVQAGAGVQWLAE